MKKIKAHILTEKELLAFIDQPKRVYVVYDSPVPGDNKKGYAFVSRAKYGIHLSFGTLRDHRLENLDFTLGMDFQLKNIDQALCINQDSCNRTTTILNKKP